MSTPVLREPPLAHALHRWEEDTRLLTYEYNGRILLSVHGPGTASVGFRHGSDGNLTSQPLVQQLYVSLDDTQGHRQGAGADPGERGGGEYAPPAGGFGRGDCWPGGLAPDPRR
jgi:hypothetical protein